MMARANGKLSERRIATWFSEMDFNGQQALLSKLSTLHGSMKQKHILALRKQLAELEGGGGVGKRMGKTASGAITNGRRKKRGAVKAKYRDPKSGATWSGRGRMASWLAAKVKAGEKADKYLV